MMGRIPPQLSPQPTLGERFGLNLWRSRRRVDLSQEELASRVGMSRPHISVLERGLDLPRIDTILRLAAATDVSVCVLLAGMEWQPGQHVEGDFHIEHPAARLRKSVQR
jgi:transcriptional regulator with XRE-family HTH domain